MNVKLSFLMCVCWLYGQPVLAEIVGTLRYPQAVLPKDNAEVVLTNVKTREVLAKVMSDKNGRFSLPGKPKPLYTIVVKATDKNDEAAKLVGEYSLWGYRGGAITINMVSLKDAISFEGRVVAPNGKPMPECLVSVDPGRYGVPEYGTWPVYIAFTDKAGKWKVDRIRPPAKWAVKEYLKSPRLAAQSPLVDESLIAGILVKGGVDYKRFTSLSVPLVTEVMQQKLGDIIKATTVSLPISTNNVIYVGDIVLPEKRTVKSD